MKIKAFTVGPFSENTYLLLEDREALLVDPGFSNPNEFDSAVRYLEASEADLLAVVLTHAHVDHILGLNRVLEKYSVPVYLSDEDRNLWKNYPAQARMFGFEVDRVDTDPEPLPSGTEWEIGCFRFTNLYTPGHAPDHVALYSEADSALLAGDTLFKRGIGRTDLYKGSMELLEQSIREQLYTLPDDTIVYPGHGPATTIGEEKQSNPFVKAAAGSN